MARWLDFPCDAKPYTHDLATLREQWPSLHRGDAEPLPDRDEVLAAWALFHAGCFEEATRAGLAAGAEGTIVANAAQLVYAHYLERDEWAKLTLLMESVARAQAHAAAYPDCAAAHYQVGYGLGRYAQGIPVVQVLAQGLVPRVKGAFERAIALRPKHADAHFGLAALHAEVIDKLGPLLAFTVSASRETATAMFQTAMRLHPGSIAGRISYATGLLMLEGQRQMAEATALYQAAAASVAHDARERLDVEIAKLALRD